MKIGLLFPEDLPASPLPSIASDRSRVRFPAYHDPDHRLNSRRHRFVRAATARPQVKKLPASETAFLDEVFEGCLPPDALIRAEPFLWLQRLYLGQLFPALFTTPRKDFSSSCGVGSGKKAVLVTTFSLGGLVCSFHEAGIIVKFLWNSQRFC